MDYSNSVCVNRIKPIAKAASCTYVPFNQMALIGQVEQFTGGGIFSEGHKGICHGLAVAWLEAQHQGLSSKKFVDDVSNFKASGTFYRSYMAYRHQMTYLSMGVKGGESRTGSKQSYVDGRAFFGDGAIVQNGILRPQAVPNKTWAMNKAKMLDLTTELCSSTSKKYFLLSVPGHAMAAVGSKLGHCNFFDPNAGMVYSMRKDRVATAMFNWFSHPTMSKEYKCSTTEWLKIYAYT